MRIKMLKDASTLYGRFRSGQVIDIPAVVAKKWCRNEMAVTSRAKASFLVEEGRQHGRPI